MRGSVVVEDQCLSGEPREVDNHVRPLGGSDEEGMLVDIPKLNRVGSVTQVTGWFSTTTAPAGTRFQCLSG